MNSSTSQVDRSFTQAPSHLWENYARRCLKLRNYKIKNLCGLVKKELEMSLQRHYWDVLVTFIQSCDGYNSEQSVADAIGVNRSTLLRWRKGETNAHLKSYLAGMVYVVGDSTLVNLQRADVREVAWRAAMDTIKKVRVEVCKKSAQTPTREEIDIIRVFFGHKKALEALQNVDEEQMRLIIEDIEWYLSRNSSNSVCGIRHKIRPAIESWAEPYSLYRLGVPDNRRGKKDEFV
jgi:hypothetical protein